VHARCGYIINTLRKKTFWTGAVRKDDEYCALCSSAAVAIGQLQLQPSHSLLISSPIHRLFASRNVTSEGPRGGFRKKFYRLAIARHIFRPPHKLFYRPNSTTGQHHWQVHASQLSSIKEIIMWPLVGHRPTQHAIATLLALGMDNYTSKQCSIQFAHHAATIINHSANV